MNVVRLTMLLDIIALAEIELLHASTVQQRPTHSRMATRSACDLGRSISLGEAHAIQIIKFLGAWPN